MCTYAMPRSADALNMPFLYNNIMPFLYNIYIYIYYNMYIHMYPQRGRPQHALPRQGVHARLLPLRRPPLPRKVTRKVVRQVTRKVTRRAARVRGGRARPRRGRPPGSE